MSTARKGVAKRVARGPASPARAEPGSQRQWKFRPGEQQVAATLRAIRRDHVARYKLAARLFAGLPVADVACGVGYGSHLLAKAGCQVDAFDRSAEAVAYAREHWAHARVSFREVDITKPFQVRTQCAVAFEILEHVEDPVPVLRALQGCGQLLVSVPNELVFPWSNHAYHFRHYTPAQLEGLLNVAGWEVCAWFGQEGPESEPQPDTQGRTIIAHCRRVEHPQGGTASRLPGPVVTGIGRVAIVAMGMSNHTFMRDVNRRGRALWDHIWAINSMGGLIQNDAVWHMDDLRIQSDRAKRRPWGPIAAMMEWLPSCPTPIYTSTAYPEFPSAVAFPLEDVVNDLGMLYFNSTVAYALAFAIHKRASRIGLFGVDFTYPNAHKAEQGRACVEFWLAYAIAKHNVDISLPMDTTLLDAQMGPQEKPYGYCDRYTVRMEAQRGHTAMRLEPRDRVPTADEMEERYNHEPRVQHA